MMELLVRYKYTMAGNQAESNWVETMLTVDKASNQDRIHELAHAALIDKYFSMNDNDGDMDEELLVMFYIVKKLLL